MYDDRGDRRGNESHDAAQEDHRRCTGEQRDRDSMSSEQIVIRVLGEVSRGTARRSVRRSGAVGARRHEGTEP